MADHDDLMRYMERIRRMLRGNAAPKVTLQEVVAGQLLIIEELKEQTKLLKKM